MKKGVFWGVALIGAALLIIADDVGTRLGLMAGLPVIRIILGVLCVAWLVEELRKKHIANIFFPLAFVFILFQHDLALLFGVTSGQLMSNWLVLLCALLLTIGISIIFPQTQHFYDETVLDPAQAKNNHHKFMGSTTRYIDCTDFNCQSVDCNMGSCIVYFENREAYSGNGTLLVDCNMGSIEIYVPIDWRITETINNSMGSVKCPPPYAASSDKTLTIKGENNMGSVVIKYVS